jgi:Mg-chelatase subunit ChlD
LYEGTPLLDKMKKSLIAPFSLLFKSQRLQTGLGVNVGRRAETVTALNRGRENGWRFPHGKPSDIHLPATIRAAALSQSIRKKSAQTMLTILPQDVREKSRVYKAPMTIVLVLDLSKSMMYNIEPVREAILRLHGDAYRYRDKVGIVALKGLNAEVVQHPATNLRVVANKLLRLKVSGQTPLAAGMLKAAEVLKEARRRDRSTIPVMVIVTDGNANIPLKRSLQTGEVREINLLDAAFFKYEDKAIGDVASICEMIKRERLYTVVINTNPVSTGWESSGFLVTQMIAKITGGRHHEVGLIQNPQKLVDRLSEAITQDERVIAHDASSK